MQMATDCGCHNKDISVNYGFQEQTRGIWSPAEGAVLVRPATTTEVEGEEVSVLTTDSHSFVDYKGGGGTLSCVNIDASLGQRFWDSRVPWVGSGEVWRDSFLKHIKVTRE